MSSPRPDGLAAVDADVTPGRPDRFASRLDDRLTRLGLTGDFRRDCALAVLVLVVSSGLVAVLLAGPARSLLPGLTPFQARAAIVVTAAQSLLLCLRRVHPVLCLWLITLLQVVLFSVLPAGGSINGVAPSIAAYTCGALLTVRRTARVIIGVTLVESAGFALRTLIPAPGVDALTPGLTPVAAGALVAGVVLTSLLTHVAAAVFGTYVATRRRYVELERVRAAEAIEAQRARADAAIGLERSRMARELHDIAAHHLSGMVVQTAVVEKLIDRDPEAAKEAAAWVRRQGKETLHNLRLVVGALREPGDGVSEEAPVPGLVVLDRLLRTARELGTPVDFVREGQPRELAPIADVTFYRVAQEALSNARDHAPGAPARVLLRYDGAGVSLEVVNDVAPPTGPADADRPTTSHRGLGLVGMGERAQMIGATLEAGPDPSRRVAGPAEASAGSGDRRARAAPQDRAGGDRMIRVVLADDQTMVRTGFRVILELAGDIEVIGEAADGPTAVTLARRLDPDVICMDVRMPGGNGLAATREIVAGATPGSSPAVLVVTTFDLDEYVFGALEAGASGFVLKDTEPDDLVDAVRRLAGGHGLLDQAVTRRVIAEFARRRPAHAAEPDAAHQLTARETDIVRLLAQGLSNAEIASELVIETSTVKSHLGRAMTKIGVRDRVQTVVWAHRNGMVPRETG